MQKTKKMTSRLISGFVAAAMLVIAFSMTAFADGYEDLEAGNYSVDADLSCFVTAMGGVEFGRPMLTGTTVAVDEDGSAEITLNLQKSMVVIYGVTAYTFIDPTEPNLIQYYNGEEWLDAEYTLSDDTAPNPDEVDIHYVDSISFTLPFVNDTYNLAVYINSNVMGVQFGGPDSNYNATLTVDWESADRIVPADETTTQSAIVNYTVTGGYEVSIPATIVVDSNTKTGEYSVEAANFILSDNAYVTVVADAVGSVTNGSQTLSFTNELESGNLVSNGDELNGTVTVIDNASIPGVYTGTLNFTISYFSGSND